MESQTTPLIPFKIAIAVFSEEPEFQPEETEWTSRFLVKQQTQIGKDRPIFSFQSCIWDDEKVDWTQYFAVILRSTWDYHLKVEKFRTWLKYLEDSNIYILNDFEFVWWNYDKHYLQELQINGIDIIETAIIDSPWKGDHSPVSNLSKDFLTDPFFIPKLLKQNGWKRGIIKPCISGGSYKTQITKYREVDERDWTLEEIKKQIDDDHSFLGLCLETGLDMMIQEFEESVSTKGEWALIFIDGQYSHTVKKTPDLRDLANQGYELFSGTSLQMIEYASKVLSLCCLLVTKFSEQRRKPQTKTNDETIKDEIPLYARVDLLWSTRREKYVVNEVEIIEPSLWLHFEAQSVEKFCDSLQQRLLHLVGSSKSVVASPLTG